MSNCNYCGGVTEHHRYCVAQRLTDKGVFRCEAKKWKEGVRPRPTTTSNWIQHVKNVQSQNPGMSYGVAMTVAKKTYSKK